MNIGKRIRFNRIFAHPSGRLCSVAVDHFIAYGQNLPPGLRHIQATLAEVVSARPDAVTMHKGILASAWAPYAGTVPAILQSTTARPDDTACEQIATCQGVSWPIEVRMPNPVMTTRGRFMARFVPVL
jgi:class I fructose-bisphosphate aldolase